MPVSVFRFCILINTHCLTGGWSSRRSRPVKSERDVVDLGATFGISLGSDSDSSDAEFAPENEEKDSADSEPGSNHHSSGEEGGDEKETDDEEEDEGEGVKQEERASKEGEGEGERKTDAGSEGERETDGGMEKEVESAPTKESGDTREEVVEEMQVHVVQKDFPNLESETADNKTKCTDAPANPKPPSATGSVESNAGSDEGKETGANTYDPLIVRRSNRAIKPTKDVDLYLLGAKFGIDVEGLSGAESSDKEFAPAENSPGIYKETVLRSLHGNCQQLQCAHQCCNIARYTPGAARSFSLLWVYSYWRDAHIEDSLT